MVQSPVEARRNRSALRDKVKISDSISVALARDTDEIVGAWRLVFDEYRQAELIDPNPWGIHAVPHALRKDTSVVIARSEGLMTSTLTIMHDSESGLCLDCVFKSELDQLRRQGRRLLEVGLFACRRMPIQHATQAIMEMMRYVFYSSCFFLEDVIVGVHPRHVPFYERNFGFVPFTSVSSHPAVKHRPVVGLVCETQKQLQSSQVPQGLADFVRRPLSRTAFREQAKVEPQSILGGEADEFLAVSSRKLQSQLRTRVGVA